MDLMAIQASLDREKDSNERGLLLKKIDLLKKTAEDRIRSEQREISFETKEYTIELAVEKYSKYQEEGRNELFVPDYQREFVWSEERQSKLIESLLIGLPIPYIFTADVLSDDPEEDGRVEIVDGSQRIRTLHAFCSNQLTLIGLAKIKELNGFTFQDLAESRQRRFLRTPIRVIELNASCGEESRRELFERINTGSDILKDMEVRKGSKLGSSNFYNNVLLPCSESPLFRSLAPMSEAKIRREEPLELALRFFAYLDQYKEFNKSVASFLNDFMEEKATIDDTDAQKMKREFEQMLLFAEKHFPNGFRKSANAKSTPRVRFEALSVGIALALRDSPQLDSIKLDWLDSKDFLAHTTSDASNSKPRVISRIEYVRDKLLGL